MTASRIASAACVPPARATQRLAPGVPRRAFAAALASTAAWPALVRAQPRTPRVGVFVLANPGAYWPSLREAFAKAGLTPGRNLELRLVSAEGDPATLRREMTQFVGSRPDLIITIQSAPVALALELGRDVPLLFVAGNPLEMNLVGSLNRPGQITGIALNALETSAKCLELLKEAMPRLRRAAIFTNTLDPGFGAPMAERNLATARSLGIEAQHFAVRPGEEIRKAFAAVSAGRFQAVLAQGSLPRDDMIRQALEHRVALACPNSAWGHAGALIAYAPDMRDVADKIVSYSVRILNGTPARELPVQQPSLFEFVVNRKTAAALGIVLPESVLVRATHLV